MMAGPSNDKCSCSEICSDDPPPLSITLKKTGDLPNETKHWSEVDRPVDILLLTVEDCELLACYHYLKDSFRSYEKSIGYVYFGKMSEGRDGSLKVALLRCSKCPGGSQTTTKNAVTLLKPKATFLVGLCYSLNPDKAQLGDVVISSKLTTNFYQTPVSSYFGNLVRSAPDGWKAPLEYPETREVNVCDGEILSCSDLIDAEKQCQSYPGAIAAEIEGKGLFAAAHEMKIEWLVVKGVCAFVHGVTSTNYSWKTFACVMAASVVSHMLGDSLVFEDWPHYRGALSSEFHSTSSTSESPPRNEQWGKSEQKTTIMERAKLGGDDESREELQKELQEFIKEVQELTEKEKVPSEIYARGPEAVKAYDKALTGGKACIKRIPVMLIGQERTGKTSLKKSLKGEKFNEKEESTVGIDTDSLYFKVSKEIWKSGKVKEEVEFEPEDQFEHLAAAKVISEFLRKQRENLTGFRQKSDSDSESDSESELESPDGSSTNISRYGSTKPSRNIESLHGKLPEEVARLVEKMLQEEENANHEDYIYSVLWDFGGQSVYYETHPIFLTEKAIYILVSDLSRDPDKNAIPPVKTGLFEDKVDSDCSKTNLDYLDFWMSSIYSLVSADVRSSQETAPNVVPRRLPPVFLVCTHADVPFDGSNARDLALKTYGFLQRKTYKEHLYKDVFVVDNTKSGSEEECTEVKRLREEVLAVAKELQLTKEEIPVKWLRYENKLRKKHDKWITREEAKWIAFEDCAIQEDDEFSTLLNFLHDQRIVIHFSGSPELERMVILDPQWLVDVLKSVITVRRFKHTEHPVKDLWIQLEETGILDEKLIDHAWRDLLDNQESHKSLIAIMERLSLISPWPSSKDSKQYLVPSMLMSPPTDDVLQLLDSVNFPSLFVTFASGRVPPGLFSRLILHFLQWCGEEWKSKVNPELFHNFAMFHILPDQGISFIFWCHSTAIEVAVYSGGNDEKRADISRAVHWKLRFILECMRKEFHWLNNVKYDICVCCPVCSRPGSVKCHDHDVRGCECLHFLSESDLRQRQHCNRQGRSLLGDRRIRVKQFECWFSGGEEGEDAGIPTNQQLQALHTTSHGGYLGAKGIFSIEGKKRKDLALPDNIKTSIQSIPLNSGSDVKDIVIQFQEALQLEPASLISPEPETKSVIRGLALRAKSEKRDDLVRHLRKITPAGTTGPLLNEDMSVGCMPHKQYKDLTFSLSGGDEWKLLAEKLGFSQIEIRFLDNRVVNPSDVVLGAVGNHRHLSIGEIYDALVDCELPAFADLM